LLLEVLKKLFDSSCWIWPHFQHFVSINLDKMIIRNFWHKIRYEVIERFTPRSPYLFLLYF